LQKECVMGLFDEEHELFANAMSGLFDMPGNCGSHAEMRKKIQKSLRNVPTKNPNHIFADANVKGLENGLEARRQAEVNHLKNSIQEFFRQEKVQKAQLKKAKKRNKKLYAVNEKLTDEMSDGHMVVARLTDNNDQLKVEIKILNTALTCKREEINTLKHNVQLLQPLTELCAQVKLLDANMMKLPLQESVKKVQELAAHLCSDDDVVNQDSDKINEDDSEHSVEC